MDTVKLEARWPPDRKSAIGASEFGIYKEPADGKRLRGADAATGCLLVLSLMAAAAVVLYFALFDYTVPTTQAVSTSVGPSASYAKYVKDRRTAMQTANGTVAAAAAAAADHGLLAAVLSVKNAENYTASTTDGVITKRMDGGGHLRTMRLFPAPPTPRRPVHAAHAYGAGHWDGAADGRLHDYPDGMYGFGRRSDFPQLTAYRAPFPPKSVLDVMKYVTGAPHVPKIPEYMVAQESKRRYAPIRPADEVNRFLPDAGVAPHGNSKRFRNKFGPPVFLTPPVMTHPDDFMKPPSPNAHYSMDFDGSRPAVDLSLLQDAVASSVQSHTDVVYRSPINNDYPVPDTPSPKRVKNKKTKSQKPISVMLDIYPITNHDPHDTDQGDEEEEENHSELFTSLKNNIQQSDRDNLLFRLNLYPKFSEGGRRMSKQLTKENGKPMIHLTTDHPLEDVENDENIEGGRSTEYDYSSESKMHTTSVSQVQ